MVYIQSNATGNSTSQLFEMVERKGLGHPDTLANLIAERFSNTYSLYCLKTFGTIINHWVDKVCLKGATTKLDFGSFVISKPIKAYLFGRVTESFDKKIINVSKLFKDSVTDVMSRVFDGQPIMDYVELIVDTNWTTGKDHPIEFYFPKNADQFKNTWDINKSNDTVMCTAYAPYTVVELLSINIENYLNSKTFKSQFPETGWDIKVLITRYRSKLDITICIPFISSRTSSFSYYKHELVNIKINIEKFVINQIFKNKSGYEFVVNLNTKDRGAHVYLTAFGSALDKGDYGAVGRGNGYEGIISVNRESNVEAVAGKNPLNHSGKLYTILANEIAWEIYDLFGLENNVNISSKNGDEISTPAYVFIKCCGQLNASKERDIQKIITKKLDVINGVYKSIIKQDVVLAHINLPNRLDIFTN